MFIVLVTMGRTVKLSDKLFAELKRRKGNASFSKYIGFILAREKDRLNERDEEHFPTLIVDADEVSALGRAGVPDCIRFNRKGGKDSFGVPING